MNTYINEKLAIIDAATPGPWHVGPDWNLDAPQRFVYPSQDYSDHRVVECVPVYGGFEYPNTTFIVDSRNHRRAELEALRIAVEALERISGDVTSDGYSYGSTHADVGECQRAATQALDAIRKKLETQ